ncbi:MAG: tetratricopeptide repeat protein [Bacteroidales bacterium]|nr:tetratricopeptide repeat protein [Bacteroidales bacterium]
MDRIDSLTALLDKKIHDTARVHVLYRLGYEYLGIDNEKAILFGKKAADLNITQNLLPDPQLYQLLGNAYGHLELYSLAIKNIEMSIANLTVSDTLLIAKANNYLAYLYMKNGVYYKSIDLYKQNIEYSKKHGLFDIDTYAYAGLANVFRAIGDKEKEIYYLLEYINHAKAKTEIQKKKLLLIRFRLADKMREGFQYATALKHYYQALEISEKLPDSMWIAEIVNRIAWNFYVMGELDSSLFNYKKSLALAFSLDIKTNVSNSLGNIGNIYRDRGNLDSALYYYNRSIKISIEADDLYNLSWLYEDISKMYAGMSDYKEAYDAYKLHTIYADSIQSHDYQIQIMEARNRYEAERNEKELELLNFKLKNNRYYNYGLASGLVLIIAIGFLLLRQNRLKTKERLSAMSQKVSEITQRNLRQQMNPHFIFNTLNSIQYFVFQNNKIVSNNYMSKFATLMRKTLDNSQHTYIPIKEEVDALKLYLELETLRFKEKFVWNIEIDDEIDTLVYKIPTMLIQPYVENSICHGLMNKEKGKGEIQIELQLKEDHIQCSIEDNGIGREKAMEIKRIKNQNHLSLGTSITESRLKLVNSIYGKQMKVQYIDKKDKNGNPEGTKVVINIPIIT